MISREDYININALQWYHTYYQKYLLWNNIQQIFHYDLYFVTNVSKCRKFCHNYSFFLLKLCTALHSLFSIIRVNIQFRKPLLFIQIDSFSPLLTQRPLPSPLNIKIFGFVWSPKWTLSQRSCSTNGILFQLKIACIFYVALLVRTIKL